MVANGRSRGRFSLVLTENRPRDPPRSPGACPEHQFAPKSAPETNSNAKWLRPKTYPPEPTAKWPYLFGGSKSDFRPGLGTREPFKRVGPPSGALWGVGGVSGGRGFPGFGAPGTPPEIRPRTGGNKICPREKNSKPPLKGSTRLQLAAPTTGSSGAHRPGTGRRVESGSGGR